MLGREAVLDRKDGRTAAVCEGAAELVMRLDAADRPAAAVHEQERAARRLERAVEPGRHARGIDVARLGDHGGRPRDRSAVALHARAGLDDVGRARGQRAEAAEQRRREGIELAHADASRRLRMSTSVW